MAIVAELADVSVRRGAAVLLEAVDWTIHEGERWVIIGPNGAGKTTLLSLLAAQSYPSGGTVSLLGARLGQVDVFDLRPRIGLASQIVAARIPPHESVRDVVVSAAYGVLGRWREAYDAQDLTRADHLLRAWHAEHLSRRTYGTLSEGERKRVEIARALMTDPELLLLDEPGGGLDLGGREKLVRSLARLCLDPSSPTTVLVTHHLEEIPPGVTHAMLLARGQVVAAGPIRDALTAATLSRAYDMDLELRFDDGRWFARHQWTAVS